LELSNFFFLFAGVVMTWAGAELLVRGSVRLALHWGISPLIIGLTIVALGTSSPEAVVSFLAAGRGVGGIALGNVLGSNIANVGLILGLVAFLHPLPVQRSRLKLDVVVMVGVSLVAATLLWLGWMGRVAGLAFLWLQCILFVYYARVARRERRLDRVPSDQIPNVDPMGSMVISWLLVVVGLLLLVLGAQWLVRGAQSIALALGIPHAVVGATMVAVGTSLPELAASVTAVLKGQHELGLGNVIGSNTMNLLFVLGGASVISPMGLEGSRDTAVLAAMLAFAIALALVLALRPRIGRREGGMLLLGYAAFAAVVYF
jgi:cation:H+ antiporter